MAAKFTRAERLARLLTVESLYLSGKTQSDIAAQIGVSQQQISKYLVKLQAVWLGRLGEQLDSVKGRELARLDRVEREYWEAWARSCANGQTTVNKAKTVSLKAENDRGILVEVPALEREWTHTERGQVGDPRFLDGIQRCIEMRLKIVGGFAPTQLEVKTPADKIIAALRSGQLDPAEVQERFPNKAQAWFAQAGIAVTNTDEQTGAG